MSDQLVIRCGDNLSDHGDLAAGELMLIRGSDMLLTLARVTGHDGTERQAEYCNAPVLLEGPAGTVRQQSNDRKASFPTWEDTAGYSYAEMEYANAYAYPVAGNLFSPLTEARRTVLWVKDKGLLLVWDRIAKAKADTRIRLNWNVQTSPTGGGANWYATVGASAIAMTQAGGTAAVIPLLLGTPLPGTTTKTLSSYQLQVTGASGALSDAFLTVFQVGAAGFAPSAVSQEGRFLRIGDLLVLNAPGTDPGDSVFPTDASEILMLNQPESVEVVMMENPGSPPTSPTFSGAAVSPAGVLHVKGVVPGWRIVRKSDR